MTNLTKTKAKKEKRKTTIEYFTGTSNFQKNKLNSCVTIKNYWFVLFFSLCKNMKQKKRKIFDLIVTK